jgi:glycosyltransferase involved in cell wall biosynthesis
VKLSLVVITRDEAARLPACLASAGPLLGDGEIVVVDSGSTDDTVALARAAGARVVHRDWTGFRDQKNAALAEARGDWVLALDADEQLGPELQAELAAFLAAPPVGVVAASMPRRNRYLGRWLRHGAAWPDRRVRLVRRGAGTWGGQEPHDVLVPDGLVHRLKAPLLHDSYADAVDHRARVERYAAAAAAAAFAEGRAAVPALLLSPPLGFLRDYVLRLGLLDGRPGLQFAWLAAVYRWKKYTRLLALRRGRSPRP